MWGPWGAPMWGGWWIFPLIGMLVCAAFMAMIVWAMVRGGRGVACMGGHGHGAPAADDDLRRQISELRREIQALRASGPGAPARRD
jgi:hypothetical protein